MAWSIFYTGTFGSNFKIVEREVLYISDASTPLNYWIIFTFAKSDGYSSAFNDSHICYLSVQNKQIQKTSTLGEKTNASDYAAPIQIGSSGSYKSSGYTKHIVHGLKCDILR